MGPGLKICFDNITPEHAAILIHMLEEGLSDVFAKLDDEQLKRNVKFMKKVHVAIDRLKAYRASSSP